MSEHPDVDVDVLVIGAGPGGLMTAHEAATRGAKVLLVERTGDIGGNAAFSTGYLAFANTSAQRAAGIVDSPDLFVADMLSEVQRKESDYGSLAFDEDLARIYAEESEAAFEQLLEMGFNFSRFVRRPHQHSVDRTIVLTDSIQLRDVFASTLPDLGVKVLTNHSVTELESYEGAVNGARIARGDSEFTVSARAVVVATGGYQANLSLCREFQPDLPVDAPFPGLASNLGEGHQLIERAGGALVNMQVVPEVVLVASRLIEDCIAVTEDGLRFHDEAGPERDRLVALRSQPGAIGYYLCDSKTAQSKAQLLADVPRGVKTVDSLSAAARMIGAPPFALEQTVARWNELVAGNASVDPQFGRVVFPEGRTLIDAPPFTIFPMTVGTNITGGGARTSCTMEVFDAHGGALSGLYAVGDCNGVFNPIAGMGGVHIAGALTLGRSLARALTR